MAIIKDVVKDVINGLSRENTNIHDETLKAWQEVLGKQALKHSKIIGIFNKRLLVNVDSSSWMFQLNIKRAQLTDRLKKINSNITDITFRIGKVK